MTLKQWCDRAGVLPTHPSTERGAVSLLATAKSPHFADLWSLDDYAVSSRSGPVVWLLPRAGEAGS